MADILDLILHRASLKKRRIGIGILPQHLGNSDIFYSYANKYAEIIPLSTYDELLNLLYKKEIEGIVRGQLDSSYQLFIELGEKYNFKKDYRVSIIKDVSGRIFFFGPTSIRWNHCFEDRKEYVLRVVQHIKDFGIDENEIIIAILLPMHQNDIIDLKTVDNMLDKDSIVQLELLERASIENEKLITYLTRRGLNAKNYDNRIEKALEENVTFIVPYNGIYGNAISRALWLVDHRNTEDKARLISLQLLTENVYNWVVENTASTEKDFSYHIIAAVAWLNRGIKN
jgi:predicted methyltransferase MtxX (methanogen marker protein 4)